MQQVLSRNAHTLSDIAGGGQLSMVSPAFEVAHKLIALVMSLALVFGAYAVLDANFRTFTLAELPQTASAAATAPATLQRAFLDLIHDLSALQP